MQEFVFSEELIKEAYAQNKTLTLTITGVKDVTNLNVSLVVHSDLGVECIASNVYTFNSQN